MTNNSKVIIKDGDKLKKPILRRTDSISNYMYITNYCKRRQRDTTPKYRNKKQKLQTN